MRGNKLEMSHIFSNFILHNLFVKMGIHQSVCFTRDGDFTLRVFADKLVVYSYYQDFTNQLKLENLGSSKT